MNNGAAAETYPIVSYAFSGNNVASGLVGGGSGQRRRSPLVPREERERERERAAAGRQLARGGHLGAQEQYRRREQQQQQWEEGEKERMIREQELEMQIDEMSL